jgi:hypothetical protein
MTPAAHFARFCETVTFEAPDGRDPIHAKVICVQESAIAKIEIAFRARG